jgi:hypothetical protein
MLNKNQQRIFNCVTEFQPCKADLVCAKTGLSKSLVYLFLNTDHFMFEKFTENKTAVKWYSINDGRFVETDTFPPIHYLQAALFGGYTHEFK